MKITFLILRFFEDDSTNKYHRGEKFAKIYQLYDTKLSYQSYKNTCLRYSAKTNAVTDFFLIKNIVMQNSMKTQRNTISSKESLYTVQFIVQ